MSIWTIDRQFKLDETGNIKTRTMKTIDAKQDNVNLYLEINKNEVPFTDFGNSLMYRLFKSVEESEIIDLISEIVTDIKTKFDLDIVDYNSIIEQDKIFIKLLLRGDYPLEVTIQTGGIQSL